MDVAPIYCCWVFILLEYKTMKKSIGKEDMAKPFVNTKVQICWWCNPKCYSDPHEWSHDAFMMACMYCNTIEWCLVVSGGTLRKISKHGALKYRVCFIHEQ
jgi:hypothetical protein